MVQEGRSPDSQKGSSPATHKPVAIQAAAAPQFHVGDTFQTPSFHIAVSSTTVTGAVGRGILHSSPAAGGEYLAVAWSYTNTSGAAVEAFQAPACPDALR